MGEDFLEATMRTLLAAGAAAIALAGLTAQAHAFTTIQTSVMTGAQMTALFLVG